MNKRIILKPVNSEKSVKLSERRNTYVFKTDKKTNRLEIKKEIEGLYGVVVENVNVLNTAAKSKSKMTKKRIIHGRRSSDKKAYVTLKKGDSIDFYAL